MICTKSPDFQDLQGLLTIIIQHAQEIQPGLVLTHVSGQGFLFRLHQVRPLACQTARGIQKLQLRRLSTPAIE